VIEKVVKRVHTYSFGRHLRLLDDTFLLC